MNKIQRPSLGTSVSDILGNWMNLSEKSYCIVAWEVGTSNKYVWDRGHYRKIDKVNGIQVVDKLSNADWCFVYELFKKGMIQIQEEYRGNIHVLHSARGVTCPEY